MELGKIVAIHFLTILIVTFSDSEPLAEVPHFEIWILFSNLVGMHYCVMAAQRLDQF